MHLTLVHQCEGDCIRSLHDAKGADKELDDRFAGGPFHSSNIRASSSRRPD
jgi:hypothetical protein